MCHKREDVSSYNFNFSAIIIEFESEMQTVALWEPICSTGILLLVDQLTDGSRGA